MNAEPVASALRLVKPEQTGRRLEVATLAMCAATTLHPSIVKGLIGPGDHVQVRGQPGSGKSVLLPHLAVQLARGEPVFGRRTRRVPVVYAAAEDSNGLRRRFAALHAQDPRPLELYVVDAQGADLIGPEARDLELFATMADGFGARAIVVDTLAAAAPGLRENESAEMDMVVRCVRRLTAGGAAVIIAHHVAKAEGSETPRGHGRLLADADAVMVIGGTGRETRRVRLTKCRAGPCDLDASFDIVSICIGSDEDGDAVTAPVAREIENEPATGSVRPVSPAARAVHGVILDALCASVTPGATTRAAVWAEGVRQGLFEAIEERDTHGQQERKRAKQRKALAALREALWIGIDGDRITDLKAGREARR